MMKTLEKRMAAREGFTLVELIVVIAILAILAAVAYPVYTGYIERANDAAALETLGGVLTAAQGVAASKGSTVTAISVEAANGTVSKISVTLAEASKNFDTADGEFMLLLTGSSKGALTGLKLGGKFASGAHYPDGSSDQWAEGDDKVTPNP